MSSITIGALEAAFKTGNVPGVDNVDGYRTDGEDRRYRNWHGLCAAATYFVCAFAAGRAVTSFPTAWAAWQVAPEGPNVGGKEWGSMPADGGFFVYWDIYFNGNRDGHVGYVFPTNITGGNFIMLHGNNTLEGSWGTNLGIIGLQYFQNLKGWKFAGWSRHYGTNEPVIVLPNTPVEVPVPAGAKRFFNAAGGGVARARIAPSTSAERDTTRDIADGDYGDMDAYTVGEAPTGETEKRWVRGHLRPERFWWLGSFQNRDVAGLPEISTTTPPVTPTEPEPLYPGTDLAWLKEPTAADFAVAAAWLSYSEALDPDETVDIAVKNEADWRYYRKNTPAVLPYSPVARSIAHWWDAPEKKPTFDGVLNTMLAVRDKSVDYVTGPGRVAKTGSLFTASYTTGGPVNMAAWTTENDPIMTTDDPTAELGYRTLAFVHFLVESLNPKMRGQSIELHKAHAATACSNIDTTRLRKTIEMFFDGELDPATGMTEEETTLPEPPDPQEPTDPEPVDPTEPTDPEEPEVPTDPTPTDPVIVTPPPAVTPAQEQAAADLIKQYAEGKLLVGDAVLARIRTVVPLVMGQVLTWLIVQFPAVAQLLNDLAPGWTELVYGATSALLGFGWWALARWLGKRWPIAEKLMLGSSKAPVYIDRVDSLAKR